MVSVPGRAASTSGAARADGFHGLATVYQTLALHDVVTVTATKSSKTTILLTADHAGVPLDARNTAWKMIANEGYTLQLLNFIVSRG